MTFFKSIIVVYSFRLNLLMYRQKVWWAYCVPRLLQRSWTLRARATYGGTRTQSPTIARLLDLRLQQRPGTVKCLTVKNFVRLNV